MTPFYYVLRNHNYLAKASLSCNNRAMFIADKWKSYIVLDTGNKEKLESLNGVVLRRPDPQTVWEPQFPALWSKADAHYMRSSEGGGHWDFAKKLPERWTLSYGPLKFYVRPTGFKHTGLFPEQAANWDFIMDKIAGAERDISVLNLFAYTGGATVSALYAGASVCHVDAAKSMVSWAKENVELSGLSDKPVRYIVDDCLKFVLREQRRGNKYHAIIMDPPSYGRGAEGQVWKIEDSIDELVRECAKLLSDPLFFIINSYTTGLSPVVTQNLLNQYVTSGFNGSVEAGDLCLPVQNSNILLPCGATARWSI